MAYKLLNTSASGVINYRASTKQGVNFSYYNTNPGLAVVQLTGGLPQEAVKGSFSLGSGYNVTTAAYVAYDADAAGSGLLVNPLMANRGNTSFYVGINDAVPAIANGMPIASGESYQIMDNVRRLWFITAAGSTVVTAQANFNYDHNQI